MTNQKVIVVINETHRLFPQQKALIASHWEEVEYLKVPEEGWTLTQMSRIAVDLGDGLHEGGTILFASPVPALLMAVSAINWYARGGGYRYGSVLLFHNDKREKKELPGGKIIQTVASEGWVLADYANFYLHSRTDRNAPLCPCQCGSGESWMACGEASPYCG